MYLGSNKHGYQSYPCLFRPRDALSGNISEVQEARNNWMDKLQQAGISTRPAYPRRCICLVFIQKNMNLNLNHFLMHKSQMIVVFHCPCFMA